MPSQYTSCDGGVSLTSELMRQIAFNPRDVDVVDSILVFEEIEIFLRVKHCDLRLSKKVG